jgi:hypothetical protein
MRERLTRSQSPKPELIYHQNISVEDVALVSRLFRLVLARSDGCRLGATVAIRAKTTAHTLPVQITRCLCRAWSFFSELVQHLIVIP